MSSRAQLFLLAACLIQLVVVGCSLAGASPSGDARCVTFQNERINAIAWDPTGASLAVVSTDLGSGEAPSVVRRIAWPELTSRDIARGQDIVADVISADADSVGWLRLGGVADEVHRFDLATGADEVLATGPIVDMQLADGQLLVRDELPSEPDRLRLLPPSPGKDVYATERQIDSFRLSRGDEALYVLEQEVGAAPVVSVVRGQQTMETPLRTAAAAHLSLAPQNGQIVYVDQSLARLVSQDANGSGPVKVLIDEDVRTGEVSRDGVIAYVVWPDTDVTTPLCFEISVA